MSATSQVAASDSGSRSVERLQSLGSTREHCNAGFDLARFCRQIFLDIDFRGKTMLEIGCGEGTLCLWAALQGAQEVVGLDAHSDDAQDFIAGPPAFQASANQLDLPQAKISPSTFQEYTAADRKFDIVLSLASINQLDEKSCIRLSESRQAVRAYEGIFRRVARMTKPGGRLIIVDAGRRNFFGDLGLRNPILPCVEWVKHQQPEDWASLLQNCGFGLPVITWTTGAWLRRLGVFRLPKTLAYFGPSIFRLEMTRR
jgi:2-polyprenyl-3-methyl-5-hydroxy-6-metoxy-1,4-benzoquinol methylase